MCSCGWPSLLQRLNLDDGLLLRVDGKADRVSRLELIKQRCGMDLVAHGHRLHKAFNFAVLHHELLIGRHDCNDLALAGDGLWQMWYGCRQKALMELGVHI